MKIADLTTAKSIRAKAEMLHHTKASTSAIRLSASANLKLIHELEVHQIELEMQQDELILENELVEIAKEEYEELYDFAPIGYFSLDKNGTILKANLFAANMLATDRAALINNRLSLFIANKSKAVLNLFLATIFTDGLKQTCELAVLTNDLPPKFIQLSGIASNTGAHCLVTALDITLIKQAAASIVIDKRRLATILIGTKAGTWEWNIQTGATIFNERWAEIIGYTLAELSPVSIETWNRLAHPDDIKLSRELLQKHFAGELEYYSCEIRMKHKKGHWVWISDKGCLNEWDVEGEPLYMSGTHQDITQSKEQEEKLNETERFSRDIVNALSFEICILDETGAIVTVNTKWDEFEKFRKIQPESVGIGVNYLAVCDAIVGEDEVHAKAIAAGIRSVIQLKQPTFSFEYPFHSPTEERWFNVIVSRFEGEGPIRIVVAHENITERKQAEEKIRKLSKAVEQSPVSIVITDKDGAMEYVNPKFESVTGYSFKEVIGKNPRILKSGKTTKEEYNDMWATLSTGATWQGEFYNLKKNGEYYWESANISPILNAAGITTHYLAIKEDITGRKLAEESLKTYASELITSNQDLENFAYIASHDLQEPLRMITGFLNLLEKRLDGKLDKDNKQFIDFAVDGAARMRVLINDLLQYSRTGTNKEAFAAIDLNEVLAYNCILLKDTIDKNEAAITVKPLPVIFANKTLMNELFVNLLTNALKYRGAQTPIIEVGFTEEPGKFIFYIKDNGIGICKEYFDKIFVIFQRLHGKGEYSGTGIGLALCKKIVETHKGKIWVVSELGKGSCFYFSIPKIIGKIKQ